MTNRLILLHLNLKDVPLSQLYEEYVDNLMYKQADYFLAYLHFADMHGEDIRLIINLDKKITPDLFPIVNPDDEALSADIKEMIETSKARGEYSELNIYPSYRVNNQMLHRFIFYDPVADEQVEHFYTIKQTREILRKLVDLEVTFRDRDEEVISNLDYLHDDSN